jgi:uncharacterized SAM-binding protein YcdF (DUF218 family)
VKNKKAIVFISFFLIVLAATGWFVFNNLALWLVVSDPLPRSLDIIFTFGGEDSRVTYSKSLFLQNPRAEWVLSYNNKKVVHSLAREGLDTTRIVLVDTCSSTNSEISFLNNWIAGFVKKRSTQNNTFSQVSDKTGLPTIGLVSNWYHMRRITLIASRRLPKKLCTVLYFSVPLSENELARISNNWWKDKIVSSIVYSEWWKIVYHQFILW